MPRNHSILYSFALRLVSVPYLIVTKTKIEGEHFLPEEGPVILASNHISFLDPVSLGYLGARRKRQIHFMAKDSLFKNPLFKLFLIRVGQIPVARNTDRAVDALEPAEQFLRKGHCVGIYPEATMPLDNKQLPIKSGAIRMAQNTGSPIVVVGTWGAHEVWRKGSKPRFKFRNLHHMVLLPPYYVSQETSIEDARVELAEKMEEATARARARRGK